MLRRWLAIALTSLALPALAQQAGQQPPTSSVKGRVEKVDDQKFRLAQPDGTKVELWVGKDTHVFEAGGEKKYGDLKPGTDVRATYVPGSEPHVMRIDVLADQDRGRATGIKRPTSAKDAEGGGSNYRGEAPFYGNNGKGGSTDSQSGVGSSEEPRQESGSAGAPGTDGKSYSGTTTAPHPTYQPKPRSPEERRQDRATQQGGQQQQQEQPQQQ